MSFKRIPLVLVFGLYGLALAVLLLWIGLVHPQGMKDQLAWLSPKFLEVTFILLVTGAVASWTAIRRSFPGSARDFLIVALVAYGAVSLIPPETHRIYYDEDIYQNVAQTILFEGKAQMCNEGTVQAGLFRCWQGEYNKEPNAFAFLLSVAFRLTGVDERTAHALNRALFTLGGLSLLWLGGVLFESRRAGYAAALVFILTPEALRWGATVAVEPGTAAFSSLALGAWLLFLRERSWPTLVFASAALAFAAQWRAESILIGLVALAMALLLGPASFRRRELYLAGALSLLLLLPLLAHLWVVRGEKWGSGEEGKFALSHVSDNLATNAKYYIEGAELPAFFTLMAVVGLTLSGRRRETFSLSFWFAVAFGIFIPFHAGSYRYGADIRFSLVSLPPYALMAGAGVALVSDRLDRWTWSRWLRELPFGLVVYAFTSYLPHTRAVGREAWEARADHLAAREMVAAIPEDGIVLSHNPGMLQVMGRSAAQAYLVTYQTSAVDSFFRRFPGGVYFHYNFWCNVRDPVQNEFCSVMLETYSTRVVMEKGAGFNRYVLYRLLPRSRPPAPPVPPD